MSLDVSLEQIPVDHKDYDCDEHELYTNNITHNLTNMASEANVYQALWRPEELGIVMTIDLIPILKNGLKELKQNPDRYKKFNPDNGWGSYNGLVRFIEEYLDACVIYPESYISISR